MSVSTTTPGEAWPPWSRALFSHTETLTHSGLLVVLLLQTQITAHFLLHGLPQDPVSSLLPSPSSSRKCTPSAAGGTVLWAVGREAQHGHPAPAGREKSERWSQAEQLLQGLLAKRSRHSGCSAAPPVGGARSTREPPIRGVTLPWEYSMIFFPVS